MVRLYRIQKLGGIAGGLRWLAWPTIFRSPLKKSVLAAHCSNLGASGRLLAGQPLVHWQVGNETTRMSKPEPILVKAANKEFNHWANFLFHRPYTSKVVAEFVDEIEEAFEKIRDHPDRYPLEGYSDYRKFGPTPKHHFKVIYTVRDGGTWIVAIAHPARRVRAIGRDENSSVRDPGAFGLL